LNISPPNGKEEEIPWPLPDVDRGVPSGDEKVVDMASLEKSLESNMGNYKKWANERWGEGRKGEC